MEQGDDGPFELCAAASVDCGGRKCFPDDRFANVGGDKEGNARAETVALLQKLVQQQDDEAGDEELDDNQEADASADFAGVAVHARHDVDDGLADGNDHSENCMLCEKQLEIESNQMLSS